jgi:ankyrin repeat protein
MLLERKADPNRAEEDGYTALMFAAQNECPACVRSLLARKADIRPKNALGMTALGIARMEENEEIVSLLLKAGGK